MKLKVTVEVLDEPDGRAICRGEITAALADMPKPLAIKMGHIMDAVAGAIEGDTLSGE